jgi:hypothetical protein
MFDPLPYLGITKHIRLLGQILEALARLVRPSSLSWVNQAYSAPYPGFRDLTPTCPTPILNISDLSALSRVTLALSSFLARFQRWWQDMSRPRPGHVRVSDTPTARFPWGAIKAPPPCLSRRVSHSFHLANTLRHSLELSTSLF